MNETEPGDGPGHVDKFDLDPASLEYRVLTELENGNKIGAIKLLREELGVGLKEAKETVETIAEEYNIPMKSGCLGVLLLAFATTLLTSHFLTT